MSVRAESQPPSERRPIANRHPAPPTATITPEPQEPYQAAKDVQSPGTANRHHQGDRANSPSRYANNPESPVRTSHRNVGITPRNAYQVHEHIETPHTLINPLSDAADQGSLASKRTRTIKDEIVISDRRLNTYPDYRRRAPETSRTVPENRRQVVEGSWSVKPCDGSMVTPRWVDKRVDDPNKLDTYLWLTRHNRLPGLGRRAVEERDRYYIETPWSLRRYPGQEPELSRTAVWAERNFGNSRDWLDTPYYDGRFYQYDRAYIDDDSIGGDTRREMRNVYRSYQSEPGIVNSSYWIKRHYDTAPANADYYIWKTGERERRKNFARMQKERVRHKGNVFRGPLAYDVRDDLDTIIQPRVKILPHEDIYDPADKPLSMLTRDGSEAPRKRSQRKEDWYLELQRQRYLKQNKAERERYKEDVKAYKEKEMVPEWVVSIDTPPFRECRSKHPNNEKHHSKRHLEQDDTFSRQSELSSILHPAPTPRMPTRVGEYNTYVGNYDTFNKYDHYYNRRKDGVPLNKYGNNYRNKNMAYWHWQ